MSRLEQLFVPLYCFLMAVGYAHFFLCMLPGAAAAFLLGCCRGVVFLTIYVLESSWRGRLNYRRFFRFYGWRWTLAAVVWDTAALALSIFLGCLNGWLILYAQKGRRLGACIAALFYLGGHLLSSRRKRNKEV